MTSLDGEFMLLGRKSLDNSNIFVQYGQGATRTVNMTGGPGIQESEFVDGLRFSMAAAMPFAMNVDIPNGVDQAALPENTIPLSEYHLGYSSSNTGISKLTLASKIPFPGPSTVQQQCPVACQPLWASHVSCHALYQSECLSKNILS